MAKAVSLGLDEVTGYFAQLEDPCSSVNRQHPLESVVVIAILASWQRWLVLWRLLNGLC